MIDGWVMALEVFKKLSKHVPSCKYRGPLPAIIIPGRFSMLRGNWFPQTIRPLEKMLRDDTAQ